jgi:hypothetical protein
MAKKKAMPKTAKKKFARKLVTKARPKKAPPKKPRTKGKATKKASGPPFPQSTPPPAVTPAGGISSSAQAPPAQRAGRLHVRMYRQGLGDCFLITIPSVGGNFYMLIDCGVVLGTSNPAPLMANVVNDIATVTGGAIDLLVATHEHWDHLSAFIQAKDIFDQRIKVKEVWLAWTEDPRDALANKLRGERRAAENALRMAVNRLAAFGATESAAHIDSLVGFFGATAGSTTRALDNVKAMVNNQPRFCQPGEPPISLEGLPGVRFWILGPPKDEKLIKKSNPAATEAYGLDAGPGGSQAFLISALSRGMGAFGTAPSVDDHDGSPFDDSYAIPLPRAEHIPFFESHYYGECTDSSLYDRRAGDKKTGQDIHDQAWRRIDSSWLDGAETMALQLDSATNNTSLVIAIEIIDSGEILLFPGDAQAGNWLSWQNLKWKLGNGKSVSAPDLLTRTILYKVGHHGSHNATLKAKGLELMVSDKLIAMIPVNHAMAVKKRWGRMPLPDLVSRIKEKTHGRVLRVDDTVKTATDLKKLKPDETSSADWEAFAERVRVNELYYEVAF